MANKNNNKSFESFKNGAYFLRNHVLMYPFSVFCASPPRSRRVESALGSHPTTMTFFPISARPATVFCVVVDFPIPPFPYMAIFLIVVLLCCGSILT